MTNVSKRFRERKLIVFALLGLSAIGWAYGWEKIQELDAIDCSKGKPTDTIETMQGNLTCTQFVDREKLVENFSWGVGIFPLLVIPVYLSSIGEPKQKENQA